MTALPTDRRDAGFTIIEVLVALAIVAVSIVAIGSLMAANSRGVRSLEQHVALMQTTRAVMMTGIPPREELRPAAGRPVQVVDRHRQVAGGADRGAEARSRRASGLRSRE